MTVLTIKERDMVHAARRALHDAATWIKQCAEAGVVIGFSMTNGEITSFEVTKQVRVNVPLELGDA